MKRMRYRAVYLQRTREICFASKMDFGDWTIKKQNVFVPFEAAVPDVKNSNVDE